MARLSDKVAIVVGAGSSGPGWGTGKATAAVFARQGAKVVAADINLKAAEETAHLIAGEGGEALALQSDATKPDDVARLVGETLKAFGRIDILDNNLGILKTGGVAELALEDWQKLLEVNLTSYFLTCKAVIPVMRRQFQETGSGGAIVNISSTSGIRYSGVPYIAYATTKGAIMPFTRHLALQHAKEGIRANTILPGMLNTPMIVEPLKDAYAGGDVAKMLAIRDAQCSMGHMGDAFDVAHAAAFLASDEARYITGTELIVDGGLSARSA